MKFNKIPDDGLRLAANMETRYDAWLQAQRKIAAGRLQWKTSGDKEYLYRIIDSRGNGTSLGPRSQATEALMEAYRVAKLTAEQTWDTLEREGRMYRALRLPRIASYGAEVLRELDVSGLLGESVLVVGTNALCAYVLEAGRFLGSELDATEDFDLTWVRDMRGNPAQSPLDQPSVFGVLKQVDSTYTVNAERPFQARNSQGNEVELLIAESLTGLPAYEKLRPIPLPEQNWLLPGQRISHITCGMDGTPARVVAPDPRWFALHKLWLSEKETRNALKKDKDRAQGETILQLVHEHMPHFPMDRRFEESLPIELRTYFEAWKQGTDRAPSAAP